jgi:TPR repeat protein
MAEAAYLFRKACVGSDLQGCYNLGLMYASGEGVPGNIARASSAT